MHIIHIYEFRITFIGMYIKFNLFILLKTERNCHLPIGQANIFLYNIGNCLVFLQSCVLFLQSGRFLNSMKKAIFNMLLQYLNKWLLQSFKLIKELLKLNLIFYNSDFIYNSCFSV